MVPNKHNTEIAKHKSSEQPNAEKHKTTNIIVRRLKRMAELAWHDDDSKKWVYKAIIDMNEIEQKRDSFDFDNLDISGRAAVESAKQMYEKGIMPLDKAAKISATILANDIMRDYIMNKASQIDEEAFQRQIWETKDKELKQQKVRKKDREFAIRMTLQFSLNRLSKLKRGDYEAVAKMCNDIDINSLFSKSSFCDKLQEKIKELAETEE